MLNAFSLAVVLIRVVALMMIVSATAAIPALWIAIKQATNPLQGNPPFTISLIATGLSHLLLASLLLVYAKKFARFMTRGLEDKDIQVNETNYGSLQAIAFSIVGVYVLIYSIPALIELIAIKLLPTESQSEGGLSLTLNEREIPVEVIIEQIVRLILALWLVLGARGIATSIRNYWMKRMSADIEE
ncbi:MAG: hypothetical protein AB1631_05880 [Acidobacteriota bacterium]